MCHVRLWLVEADLRYRRATIRISHVHQPRRALLLRARMSETGRELQSAFRAHQEPCRSADMFRVRIAETIPAHVLRLRTSRTAGLIMEVGRRADLRPATVEDHITVHLHLRETMDVRRLQTVDPMAGLRLRLHTEAADQCHLMVEVERRLMAVAVAAARCLCRHTAAEASEVVELLLHPSAEVEHRLPVAVVAARVGSVAAVVVTCHPAVEAVVIAAEVVEEPATAAVAEAATAITKAKNCLELTPASGGVSFQCPSSPAGARSGVSNVCAAGFCGRSGGGWNWPGSFPARAALMN